jgi:histidyl-tRNA synthetase
VSEGAAKREEKPRKFQAIKGTRDLLPPETALWNRVEQTAQEVFASYGFGEIRLPVFEANELFARSIGSETDIVSKEMYTFEDWPQDLDDPRARIFASEEISRLEDAMARGELPNTDSNRKVLSELQKIVGEMDAAQARNLGQGETPISWLAGFRKIFSEYVMQAQFIQGYRLGLRPEATASVCRAYIENGMQQLPQPVKLYTIGPMFRRERPQKGRYRQFYQINAEVLGGSDAPGIDAEVIEMVMTFFERLELQGVQLDINSIGCRECRPKYVEKLRAELLKIKDKLGADSQRRIETNPLRVLDSKLEHEQPIIEKLPHIADHLCEECKTHYAAVKKELGLRGVKYHENWRLVRGLDYYMRTTFEITAKGLGSQNAVCGGGRYDGLVELLGGPPTKGIGFAIGEDRLILSLQESGKGAVAQGRDVYIAWMGENARATAIRAAKNLRSAGFSVELPPVEQKFGKALGQADKLGARYALILGDNEVASGEWTLKALATGEQAKFTETQLLEYLKKRSGEWRVARKEKN